MRRLSAWIILGKSLIDDSLVRHTATFVLETFDRCLRASPLVIRTQAEYDTLEY